MTIGKLHCLNVMTLKENVDVKRFDVKNLNVNWIIINVMLNKDNTLNVKLRNGIRMSRR